MDFLVVVKEHNKIQKKNNRWVNRLVEMLYRRTILDEKQKSKVKAFKESRYKFRMQMATA